jgi:hypothetical protein
MLTSKASRNAFVLLFSLLAIFFLSCARNESPKTPDVAGKEKAEAEEPELEWAKEIADLFLSDVSAAKFDHASRLVVKARQNPGPGSLVSSDLRDEVEALNDKFKAGDEITSWKISSKLLSPSKDEAVFKGTLERPKRTTSFSLRVVKEKSDGKWRVEAFSAKTEKSKKG